MNEYISDRTLAKMEISVSVLRKEERVPNLFISFTINSSSINKVAQENSEQVENIEIFQHFLYKNNLQF